MSQTESTLVVLIDADDVKDAFSAWPDDICLAVCLHRDGDCNMIVFRRDERPQIPGRLIQVLDVPHEDVCFVPKVHGYPTKHFLYSDERRLMALVGSDPEVLDEAIDYAVNYTYALEEGLDPAAVLGWPPTVNPRITAAAERAARRRIAETQAPDAQERTRSGELSPLLPDFLRRSAEQSRRPKFASVRTSKLRVLASQL